MGKEKGVGKVGKAKLKTRVAKLETRVKRKCDEKKKRLTELASGNRDGSTSSTASSRNDESQQSSSERDTKEGGGGLWERAAEGLEQEDRARLQDLIKSRQEARQNARQAEETQGVGSPPNVAGTTAGGAGSTVDGVDIVLSEANKLKHKDGKAAWRTNIDNIISGAIKFKSLGDAAAKFDQSGYAALAWSVVSFGLQVAANEKETREFALSSSEIITELTPRYAQYEKWFRGQQPDEEFDIRLVAVYKAIVLYLIALDDYLRLSKPSRFARATFETEERSIYKKKEAIVDADAKARDWIPIAIFKMNRDYFAKWLNDLKSVSLPKPDGLSGDCLRSLAFPEMDSRANDIDAAAKGTCDWLPQNEVYRTWVASNQGLLWIKGKPGSGKSTLLRHIIDNAMVASIGTDAFVLSFFLHGRGTELQKTPLGLFRSLLYQLLSRAPGDLPDLVDAFMKHRNNEGMQGTTWSQWELGELKRLFKSSLSNVLEKRPVWLFIDALDESGKTNAVNLVNDFKSFVQALSSTTFSLRICFTCRQYPIIDLDNGLEICLGQENRQAIETYVGDKLSAFSGRTSPTIPALIINRADGVFLWASLMVERVLEREREGGTPPAIEDELRLIPADLHTLYQELLREMTPASAKLIQWICFAMRPLSLDELRWAMVVDFDSRRSLEDCKNNPDYVEDNETMERKLKTLSHGLAEAVPGTDGRVVQFIHQSVRDFLVDEGLSSIRDFSVDEALSALDSNRDVPVSTARIGLAVALIGLAAALIYLDYFTSSLHVILVDHFSLPIVFVLVLLAFWPHHEPRSLHHGSRADHAVGIAHYRISRSCIRYLEMVQRTESAPHESHNHRQLNSAALVAKFPLLSYATTSWTRHTIESQSKKILQDDLLVYFEWPLETLMDFWVLVYTALEKYSYGCPSKDAKMIHVVSKYSLLGPLREILRRADETTAGINANDGWNRTPLSLAAENGHEAVIKLLLETRKVEIDSKDANGQTPLSSAARNGHEAVVKLLLETRKVEIDSKDANGQTPLLWAAENGHEAVVKLLLETRKVEIDSKDEFGQTPLLRAVSNGHEAVVKLLLETREVEINSEDKFGQTPLKLARINGHEGVIALLQAWIP